MIYLKTSLAHISFLLIGLSFFSGCIIQEPAKQPPVEPQPTKIDASCISASAEKMNVFYIGVQNPLVINGPAASLKNLRISGVGGGIAIKKGTANKYSVTVRKPGECRITISGGGVNKSMKFRIKRIPDPIARLSRSTGGAMGTGEFKAQGGVGCFLDNFDFDATCQIMGYELTYIAKRQDGVSSINSGARYNDKSRRLIMAAKPGDTYIFDNIRAKCPGDVAGRKINAMAFRIR